MCFMHVTPSVEIIFMKFGIEKYVVTLLAKDYSCCDLNYKWSEQCIGSMVTRKYYFCFKIV